ncbi:MAG: PKD domain-containing protein, partial [Bacteroidota bacterium]
DLPDDSGATYMIEITPAAQEVCNDSPTFDFFPPTVICANEPLDFDHSATDPDGDQLVYEFCSPLLGGGTDGGPDNPNGDPASCTGIQPNPPCPPSFNDVRWRIPTYSPTEPLAGDPIVTISPGKGEITGTPRTKGQFVVGVCVSEYRNGVLLSTVRRDFQFNVEDCEPTVVADVQADEQIGDQEYLVNSCGNNTLTFINESFQRSNIDTYYWEFDIKGTTERFNEWDATVTFPDTGLYRGMVILNPGTTCGDTANIFVNVFPDITADFEFGYDTCNFGAVSFRDLSFSASGPIRRWDWRFGDGNVSSIMNPNNTYSASGDWPVTLLVEDRNSCQEEIEKILPYYPVPPLIILEPSAFEGCAPLETLFKIRGTPFEIDSTYDVVWNLGDGTVVDELSPLHLYNDAGLYDISVEVTSPVGCFTSADFPNWVDVSASPIADFSFTPENPSNFNPTVSFFDESSGAASWAWDFGGLGNSIQRNPTYTFRDTGLQVVELIVTHPSGCMDTILQELDIEPQVRYFLPNAFTPNADDINDVYQGVGVFAGMVNFEFSIWNRWGEMIFQTNDPNIGWNGRKNNTGRLSPNGVYVCLVSYEDPRGNQFEIKGVATLVR